MKAHVSVNEDVMRKVKSRLRNIREFSKDAKARITVGLHEKEGAQPKLGYRQFHTDDLSADGDTASLIEVATAHEFGTSLVPERSFIRLWVDQNQNRLRKEMREYAEKLIVPEAVKSSKGEVRKLNTDHFMPLGSQWAKEIQEWMKDNVFGWPSLSDATVHAKAAANIATPDSPLIATKQLMRSIRAKVNGKYAE